MNKKLISLIAIFMAIFFVGCTAQQAPSKVEPEIVTGEIEVVTSEIVPFEPVDYPTFYMVSDVHHLARSLYEENETFKKFYQSGDGKLVQYTQEIMQAFVDQIKTEKPQYLIVSGDLTTNGEKASHEELAKWFSEIENAGTRVLVIPGNHDINNPHALSFLDNKRAYVDSVSPEDFRAIYEDFGYNEAISEDRTSLSYLAKASDNLYVLMLDTCIYDNNVELGFPVTGGQLTSSTLMWIDSLKEEIPEGAKVISVSHHNMLVHAEMLSDGYTLYHAEEALKHLKQLGISQNFSGHIHTQDVKVSADGSFADIVTGSMIQYPQEYAILTTSETGIQYLTSPVAVSDYAKGIGSQDAFLLDFEKAAKDYFYENSMHMAYSALEGYTDDEIAQMADVIGRLNVAYFAGEEPSIHDDIVNSEGYALWQTMGGGFINQYIETMLADDTYGDRFEMEWQK